MNILIALIGAKGAGKTTAFNSIKELVDVQEITLASKLKDVCAQVFNIPREHFDSHQFKEKEMEDPVFLTPEKVRAVFLEYSNTIARTFTGHSKTNDRLPDSYVRSHVGKVLISPRQVAQYIGTEVLRNFYEDIHCIEAMANVTKNIGVVTDMRFPNEFNYFAGQFVNYHPIYIQNVGAEVQAGKDTHASEAHLPWLAKRAAVTIQNNGSINDFEYAVKAYVKGIL